MVLVTKGLLPNMLSLLVRCDIGITSDKCLDMEYDKALKWHKLATN